LLSGLCGSLQTGPRSRSVHEAAMKALQDLRLFVHAARAPSLSAAARDLDISPAAASMAIKRLETELDVHLLARYDAQPAPHRRGRAVS